MAYIYTQLVVHCLNHDLTVSSFFHLIICRGWPLRILPVTAVLMLTLVRLFTDMHLICSSSVVHGQGEGRGAVAPQTDCAEAREAHGKSCHLVDIRPEDFVFFQGRGGLSRCCYSLIFFHPFWGHEWTWIVLECFCFNIYTCALLVSKITAVPVSFLELH